MAFVPSLDDISPLTYQRIQDVADAIAITHEDASRTGLPTVVPTRQNSAKALGQTLADRLDGRPVMALDEVEADDGDYLDIGSPLADGDTVPLVVKTLAFGN